MYKISKLITINVITLNTAYSCVTVNELKKILECNMEEAIEELTSDYHLIQKKDYNDLTFKIQNDDELRTTKVSGCCVKKKLSKFTKKITENIRQVCTTKKFGNDTVYFMKPVGCDGYQLYIILEINNTSKMIKFSDGNDVMFTKPENIYFKNVDALINCMSTLQ